MSVIVSIVCDHQSDACDKLFVLEEKGDVYACGTQSSKVQELVLKTIEASVVVGWHHKKEMSCCPKCYLMDKPQ